MFGEAKKGVGKEMKAIAVFPARREVKLIEQEEPMITQPDQVKLRILDVGICGTDKEICSFVYGTPPAGSEYLMIGHEALGEVVEVGTAVTDLVPGDLVVPTVRRPCPHARCRSCQAGHQDFCETGDFEQAVERIVERPAGIKSVISFQA